MRGCSDAQLPTCVDTVHDLGDNDSNLWTARRDGRSSTYVSRWRWDAQRKSENDQVVADAVRQAKPAHSREACDPLYNVKQSTARPKAETWRMLEKADGSQTGLILALPQAPRELDWRRRLAGVEELSRHCWP